jgi:hypothetical protein
LDLSFSKKFMKDQLTLSIYADDVLTWMLLIRTKHHC